MSQLSARFRQSPSERKRYVLDYTLELAAGEQITSLPVPAITQTNFPQVPSPALVVDGIVLIPDDDGLVRSVAYYTSGGSDTCIYEINFLATTSITQVLEDVVQMTISVKT